MDTLVQSRVIRKGKMRNELAERLARETQGEVLFNSGDRGRYATDASIYQTDPIGVLIPKTFEDVRIAVDVCRDMEAPVIARGAGSSQCGQTVGHALILDNSKYLNHIVELDLEAMTVTVEPGIVLDHLNTYLRPHGVWFPVDVSTALQCTIGGMAGNNSCGSRSIAYGNMVHNVLGIETLLSDGTQGYFGPLTGMAHDKSRIGRIVQQLQAIAMREHDEIARVVPKVLRRVGGYNLDIFNPQSERPYTSDGTVNLAHLLVGSEGTLAISRNLKLKLSPLPGNKTLGVISFPTLHAATDSAQHIVKLVPQAVELVDRSMIELGRANPEFGPIIDGAIVGEPRALLLVEFAGPDRAEQIRKLDQLVELMGDLGLPGSVVRMVEPGPQQALWGVRKAGLNIMMSIRGDGKPVSFIEDCAVPLDRLAEYTDRLTEIFERHGTSGTWYAHASVGTLHVRPILDMRTSGAALMRTIANEASAVVHEFKGAYSGEHGDGLARSEWISWQFGPRLTQAFEEIKELFDPIGLLNPGKIVRSPKMDDTSLFRFKPSYQVLPFEPALDWSAWNVTQDPAKQTVGEPGSGNDPTKGYAKAIEMCNNNGNCRKFDTGTMCPSYRATRDEQHSTRGRANTLRLAISGQLGSDAFVSEEVRDSLDLCVGCKGCRRECPTGVDMAKMKVEFLYQWQKQHGVSLKDRMIATMPKWAPWAARLPWLFNLRDRLPGVPWLTEKWLGFSAKRSLPKWRGDTFLSGVPNEHADDADVVLFADTFNNYLDSENARAALKVLQAAGYKVYVARPDVDDTERNRPLCCGRTYLSCGLVDEAKIEARRVVKALLSYVERGVPIVGLEPSCLLSMRDEFLTMGLGVDAQKLGKLSFLFEEFLAREHKAGNLHLKLKALPQKHALLHGHCHQKSFNAVQPVQTILSLIPDLKTELITSSCCGMAGSFGYDAKHYDVSMQMAELSLLPAIRAADSETLLIADGTSCRHQIADGSGREAIHVARVLEGALA
ncbi:MAG: FAD-binding protein [Alcaligenaceae bacterium]|nr:FAD-binding protein [Alcaligenaceae bacterium]